MAGKRNRQVTLDPAARARALLIAGGDEKRLRVLSEDEVLVVRPKHVRSH